MIAAFFFVKRIALESIMPGTYISDDLQTFPGQPAVKSFPRRPCTQPGPHFKAWDRGIVGRLKGQDKRLLPRRLTAQRIGTHIIEPIPTRVTWLYFQMLLSAFRIWLESAR